MPTPEDPRVRFAAERTLLAWVRTGLIYAMLAATALSGLQYLWRAAHLFRTTD